MVQSEIFGRVFRIVFGSNAGTTFTIEQDGTQFLVTAKHIFKDAQFPAQAEIRLWKEGQLSIYSCGNQISRGSRNRYRCNENKSIPIRFKNI